ncbi:hypothetical protein NLG97_g7885 [Lecanicillium saksenae]|uniref:Uncharacterized protein n=1 Tax=Lecanicillium saksenae TaxID=468837 RepID=A0ACC1QLU4_9HYPO|nr:hypothetical protein NLG97_g7885 [Lecanicillium saksenae]
MEAEIDNLLQWAKKKGIEINGCTPKQLHGRGVGIVATRPLKANEVILRVPTDTLRSLANTPKDVVASLPGATVHAILSASLCLDRAADLDAWRAVFPSKADIHAVLPICWPSELRALLPHTATTLLARQSAKFNKDWAAVEAVYGGDLAKEDFLYAWLLVNTRSFYHTTRKTAKLPKEDHMVLQPVADLFNHSPTGWCAGAFNEDAFTITTQEAHEPGQELFIKYGSHANGGCGDNNGGLAYGYFELNTKFANIFGQLSRQDGGYFGHSCQNIRYDNGVLTAECGDGNGGTPTSSINLNEHICNVNGQLEAF